MNEQDIISLILGEPEDDFPSTGASDPPQGPVQFWTHLKNLSLKIEHISTFLGSRPQKGRNAAFALPSYEKRTKEICSKLRRSHQNGGSPKLGIPPISQI